MEVSKQKSEPEGHELIQKVVGLTGLPKELIRRELDQILEDSGQIIHDQVTLQQLREAMAAYLEAVYAELSAAEKSV